MEFIDATEMAKSHPNDFSLPDTSGLKPGSIIKIASTDGARHWVLLTAVDGDKLTGTIDKNANDDTHGWSPEITFARRHVYLVYDCRLIRAATIT